MKKFWLLLSGLACTSGVILLDRYIVDVPEWLAILCAVVAIGAFVMFWITSRKQRDHKPEESGLGFRESP